MNYADLDYFAAVVQNGNLTRAADQLHITQPSISKAISRIEEDAGATLFTRTGNKIQLNYYGEIYYRAVLHALGTLESTIDQVKDHNGRTEGNIRIASTMSGILDPLLMQFYHTYPTCKISQVLMSHSMMADRLLESQIDLAFSSEPIIDSDILWEPLLRDELYLMVTPEHPLYGCIEAPLSAFRNDRIIVNNAGLLSNNDVLSLCRQAGFEPKLLYSGGEAELIIQLNENCAVTFIPASTIEHMSAIGTADSVLPPLDLKKSCIRITAPSCFREYGVATIRNRYHSPMVQKFHELATAYFQDIRNSRSAGRV